MAQGPSPGAGFLWALSQRLVREGMTFRHAWDLVRESGLPVTRDTFLGIWRPAAGLPAAQRQLGRLPGEMRPTASEIQPTPLRYPARYAYIVEVEGTHRLTGGTVSQPVTVLTNRLMSKDAAIAEAVGFAILDPDLYELDPTGAEVASVFRSAGR